MKHFSYPGFYNGCLDAMAKRDGRTCHDGDGRW